MTKEKFEEILQKEGVKSKKFIDSLWDGRPYDNLNEQAIKETAQWFVENNPRAQYSDAEWGF